jgi:hypothetical protein
MVEDGRSMLDKAQDIKRLWNDPKPTCISRNYTTHITATDLHTVSTAIGVVSRDGNPVSSILVNKIDSVEKK